MREAIRLFAYKAGARLFAYEGDIEIKALKDSINAVAKLNITMTANKITLAAKEELLLNGGGSYIRLNAQGNTQGTPGSYVNHAASHSLVGPDNLPVTMPMFPESICKPCMVNAAAMSSPFAMKT